MAVEDKVTLLNSIKNISADILTQNQADQMLGLIADELGRYDIEMQECDRSNDDCLDIYLAAKYSEGKSPETLFQYKYKLTCLMKRVKVPTKEITVYHLRKFLSDEKARGISDETLKDDKYCFSAYFNWLFREGLIPRNPVANLGAIKGKKVIKPAYQATDVERLKRACRNLRDLALISFLSATGCRVGEVVRLNRDDIDLQNYQCKVLGKGDKERMVYFDSVTAMVLREYLESRTDNYESLFPGNAYRDRSNRLSAQGIRRVFTTLRKRAGVDARVHPHKFRRTLATNLIHKGMPIQEVAAILGHEKLDTTMKYVVIDQTDVHHHYNKYA